jgi:hypothetical protein
MTSHGGQRLSSENWRDKKREPPPKDLEPDREGSVAKGQLLRSFKFALALLALAVLAGPAQTRHVGGFGGTPITGRLLGRPHDQRRCNFGGVGQGWGSDAA